jgi:DNA (cytosine-5)-methyltransferase 1
LVEKLNFGLTGVVPTGVQVIDLDETEDVFKHNGLVPEGAEVIDVESFEEKFLAEFEAEQALPANPARATTSMRNLPVTFPWVTLENIKIRDSALKAGKTVELTNGHFLQLTKILKNSVTKEIKLRGWLLKRTRNIGGLLEQKLNELCYVHEVLMDDSRPMLEQSVHEVGFEDVVETRLVIRTNWPFPAHRAIFESISDDMKANKKHAEKHDRLVVRWKYITYYENAQEQAKTPVYQGNTHKWELSPINEDKCSSPEHHLSPDIQRLQWRGDTLPGGAHNAPIIGGQTSGRNLERSHTLAASGQKYTYGDSCKNSLNSSFNSFADMS